MISVPPLWQTLSREQPEWEAKERESGHIQKECKTPDDSLMTVGEHADENRATIDQAPRTTSRKSTVPYPRIAASQTAETATTRLEIMIALSALLTELSGRTYFVLDGLKCRVNEYTSRFTRAL